MNEEGNLNEWILWRFISDYISHEAWVGDSLYILQELSNKVSAFKG